MPSGTMADFVAALPKAELHLHLMGSASPETVMALARRHPDGGVPVEPEPLRRFYAFTDFSHFLQAYAKVSELVRTGADVLTLLDGLGAQLAAATVRYAEVQVGPLRHQLAGISFDELAQALADGHELVRQRHDVELAWIINADTSHGADGAEQTLRFVTSHRPVGTVGIGLGGPERDVLRADYAKLFRAAREAGLRSAPHAGETVGAGEVWSALRDLGAERIGHGLSAATDPALCAYLAEHDVTLEICPTSNLRTGAVDALNDHPLPALLSAGVPVALGTDDPGMFGTDLNREYLLCHTEFGLGRSELAQLARAAVRAAFCSPSLRDSLLAEISEVEKANSEPAPGKAVPTS